MTSYTDLIKTILRISGSYTKKQLEKLPDEELIMIKLIAERKQDAATPGKYSKQIIVGNARRQMNRRGRKH
ncbi:MAG TPA: hypothetical protein VI757_08060 [Bacteroidia bacterium]|nr:hypothetical protein [Bacteroidia bacterium]